MKIAQYHCLIGDYDEWLEPLYVQGDIDYFLFTDQPIKSPSHKVIKIRTGKNPILTARRWKIVNGMEYLKGYDLIIYTDTNIRQMLNLHELISLQRTDLMILKHPTRNCIYDEFHACNEGEKDDGRTMYMQICGYQWEGYPEHNGLVASGVMFRRYTPELMKLMRAWLKEIENGSIRDQLSFNYVAWKHEYKFDLLPFLILQKSLTGKQYFEYRNKHKHWKP